MTVGGAVEVLVDAVIARAIELAEIPAPTHREARRAARVAEWWRRDGLDEVHDDSAGNVWARLHDGAGPALLLCAHLDTVFGTDVDHRVRHVEGRLVGPGIGDDSLGVAALSAIAGLLDNAALTMPVWVAATVGEEGLGNLAGIRHALASPPHPLAAVIAIEGNYLGRVVTVAVGSIRWRVDLSGPGGHAWEEASAPSAVHEAAAVVHRLTAAGGPRRSVNVGRIGGGEAINARARHAWFEVDMRADDAGALRELEALAAAALDGVTGMDVHVEEIGRRPAGRIDETHRLVAAATESLRRNDIAVQLTAASTDANAALDNGLPAIAVGITTGAGEHTPQEWIDTAPIGAGLEVLASTVNMYGRRL